MKIYLAGPMTGIPHHNTPAFDAAAARLRALGHDVVSPPDITRANPQPDVRSDGTIAPASYCALIRLDIAALLDCEAIAVLPGWDKSKGARLEVAIAMAIGLKAFYVPQLISGNLQPLRFEVTTIPKLECEEVFSL